MDIERALSGCTGFQWDQGNSLKSWLKHRVARQEAEQVFFINPVFFDDEPHSEHELRFLAFGIIEEGRHLVVAFTIRELYIRIISARAMNRKEKEVYEKTQTNPQV
ncbi:MAG: BrnT family toxin [Candidatus Omnitrophica bacterium]|nr:BrnT family toxin [Candidatus Omnitrophota bacterium]